MLPTSPATRADMVALVASATPTFDTATQRALFDTTSVERLAERGQRRPELVWSLPSYDGAAPPLVGARDLGDLALVDLLALPDDAPSTAALLGAATAWARTHDRAEASFGAPASESPLEPGPVRAVVDAFAVHGWQVLVTRRHYEFAPAEGLGDGVPLHATLEPAQTRDHERLRMLVRSVLVDSLDVRDRAAVARLGLDAAADELATDLVESDPIECIRFAVVDGEDAGLVSWTTLPSDRGLVAFVGVAPRHRGRGLATGLVAAATRSLVEHGARTLIADTDDDNRPMARAFARVGWKQTESRIDLVLR